MKRRSNLRLLVDPVSEHGDIGVDAGVVGVSTADSPGGGADDFVVEEDWSAGVTLAGVFASLAEESSAEHTLMIMLKGVERIRCLREGFRRCSGFGRCRCRCRRLGLRRT